MVGRDVQDEPESNPVDAIAFRWPGEVVTEVFIRGRVYGTNPEECRAGWRAAALRGEPLADEVYRVGLRAEDAGVIDRPVFARFAVDQSALEYETAKGLKKALFLTECTWMRKRGVRTRDWKLILAREPDIHNRPPVELYHLATDPGEQQNVEKLFPAIVKWVRGYGHIEIGDQEMFGFVVRALDYGGLVFEDNKAETLAEALVALEKGLEKWFEREGIDTNRV